MVDLSAIAKWPNVPACYDWLSLDRRGEWRLQGERVTHSGLIAFINRQYGCDESGCWFLQNGPQRVFVSLAYTPWILRRTGEGFTSHTGEPTGLLQAVYLDEAGSILLATNLGIGLLDDRDLAQFLGECRQGTTDDPADDDAFEAMMSGSAADIRWNDLPLERITAQEVPLRFAFNPQPQPTAN